MGGKNPTTTTTQSSAPDPNAYNAYLSVLGQAQGLGSSTYQPYTGQLTAPVNQEQTTGIQGVNSYANAAQPAYQAALTQAQASSAPLTAAQIQQYQSPYTQQVVNATQNQFNQQNAQAQQGILGNAIAQGALGGNRSVIGQAELAGQQQTAQAPVIAGLENTGYNQAVSTAENQQQLGLQGAGLTGQLGAGAQTAGLQGAGQQIAAGTLQQTTQQAQDQALYQQYLNQQAYPYQQLSWLAGIDTGVGSNMGGTGNGTTVGPSPNVLGQVIGAGTAAAGLFGMSDRRVKENIQSIGKLHNGMTIYRFNFKGDPKTQIGLMAQDVKKDHPEAVKLINGILHVDHKKATDDAVRRALGGVVPHFDSGGVASIPYGGMANSIFPSQPISHGSGPPRVSAPNQPSQQQSQNQEAQNLGSLAKSIMSAVQPGGGTPGTSVAGDFGPSSYGGPSGPTPLVGMASGGGVRGYDDGGGVAPSPFDDRWNALYGDQAPPDDPSGAPYFIDADASQRWRSGVDTDLNRGQTMQALNTPAPAPPEGAPIAVAARGVAPPSQTKALANDVSSGTDDVSSSTDTLPPEIALGYAGGVEPRAQGIAPATPAPDAGGQDTSPVNSRFGPDSKLWPALVSAGFATMASRSPYLGNMIGEGGQAGIGSYNKQTEQERADKLEQQKMAFDRYKFDRPYSELTAEQKVALARQQAQDAFTRANQPVTIGPDGKPMVNSVYTAAEEANRTDKWAPIGSVIEGDVVHPLVMNSATHEVLDAATQKPPSDTAKFEVRGQKAEISNEDAADLAKYTVDTGDTSRLTGLGYSGSNKVKVQAAINQYKREHSVSDNEMARRRQEFAASGIGMNAGARTRATREENLGIILNTTEAAIPAAIQASKDLARTGFVPLNQIIQEGRLITSDPAQVKFGIANLQLAEGWARTMNPTGVMRDADRDLALKYLNTAWSQGTYEQAVEQVHRQIIREKEAVHKGTTSLPMNGEAPVPGMPTAVSPSTPPAGAVGMRKDTQGNLWYVDKDGKPIGSASPPAAAPVSQ